MRDVSVDERPRLLLGVLLYPAYVLGFGPAMQRVWKSDGRAYEDMVQHDEWRKPSRVLR